MSKTPISKQDLLRLSAERFSDALELHRGGRYGGAFYMCGYSIELRLKHATANTLGWESYPRGTDYFFKPFYSHDLNFLLAISGNEVLVNSKYEADWIVVRKWDPGMRYDTCHNPITELESHRMLDATSSLGRALYERQDNGNSPEIESQEDNDLY